MRRFHRGGKEWRLYSIHHLIHIKGPGRPYFRIKPLYNTKNSKKKNEKQNRKLQDIYTYDNETLYKSLDVFLERRGCISTDALFVHPLDKWRVNPANGKCYGYKNSPIGHNSLQKLLDHLLLKCLAFNNKKYVTSESGSRRKKSIYTLYGLRPSMITAAVSSGMNNDGVMLLSQHASATEIETYIRSNGIARRTEKAQNQFRDFVLKCMYYIIFKMLYKACMRIIILNLFTFLYSKFIRFTK